MCLLVALLAPLGSARVCVEGGRDTPHKRSTRHLRESRPWFPLERRCLFTASTCITLCSPAQRCPFLTRLFTKSTVTSGAESCSARVPFSRRLGRGCRQSCALRPRACVVASTPRRRRVAALLAEQLLHGHVAKQRMVCASMTRQKQQRAEWERLQARGLSLDAQEHPPCTFAQ